MDADYDLIVLGTGSAGTKIAQDCRAAGWRVLIVEERAFGGTCALRGCEPKKALWTVAEAADRVRRLGERAGLATGGDAGTIAWPKLMAFKRSFTEPVPEARSREYAEAGIDALSGMAHFTGPNAIAVGDKNFQARHIVIATGAMPAPLPIEGIEHLTTSDAFMELEELPRDIVLVGGGYISFEFAHIARSAGANVTLLHNGDTPLEKFDKDLVERLVDHSRRQGIRIELGAEVKRIEPTEQGVAVHSADGRRFEASIAVHGLGRVPNIDRLDLSAGEVESEKGKLKLDGHLRSVSNPAVFAAGDAASVGPPLTPVSTHDAECVARNLIEGCRHDPDYEGVASVVFTIPPLAMVGLTEAAARKEGRDIEVRFGDMSDYQSVRRVGHEQTGTAYKIVLDRKDGCILGAHLFQPMAQEVINLFALSIRLKLPASDLTKLLSAYPSEASNISNMLG